MTMNRKTSQIVAAMREDPDNCNWFSVKCSCGHVNDLAYNPTCQNEQCRKPVELPNWIELT